MVNVTIYSTMDPMGIGICSTKREKLTYFGTWPELQSFLSHGTLGSDIFHRTTSWINLMVRCLSLRHLPQIGYPKNFRNTENVWEDLNKNTSFLFSKGREKRS